MLVNFTPSLQRLLKVSLDIKNQGVNLLNVDDENLKPPEDRPAILCEHNLYLKTSFTAIHILIL